MAEAAAGGGDEGGTRSMSAGSRRSQRGDYRRRRRCTTQTSAAVGTTDDNLEHGGVVAEDEPTEHVLHRRGAVRERRRRYVDADGAATVDRFHRRGPLFEENLMMGEPMMLDRIDGLNDAWDAGRFVAVLRQRRDLLFGVTEHDLLNALIGDDGFGGMGDRAEHVFPVGESRFTECFICMEFKNLHLRVCCNLAACDDCLRTYLSTQVEQAVIKIQCIGADCSALMHRDEILARLSGADKARYAQFLIDANCDPLRRTCPRCSHVLTIDTDVLSTADRNGLMVTCAECGLDWCFPCHAPWHARMKCSDFRRGDKLLKAWAREQHYGQANAQKCPKCKFYIQRSSGCDHMTCSRCKTDFCYRCGERFRELKFVGNHYSKLSIFGCKYRFKPTQPVQRRLIRGSIFAAQLMAVPALGALALGAGAIVASVGSLVLPFYAGYKLHKRLERRRSAKRRRRAREAMWRKLEDMRWRGEELDISHPMLTELDTSQIIRSYIGVELTAVDSNVSTSDDADSAPNDVCSALDVSSSTDDEDDSDDESLHIRDEACQTGDDDIENPVSETRRVRCFPISTDWRMTTRHGGCCGLAVEEDVSVWRTLLHNDDMCHGGVGSDAVKHKVDGSSWCQQVTCGSETDDARMSSSGDAFREGRRRHFVRSQSDSCLLPFVCAKRRTLPVPLDVTAAPKSRISCDWQADLCHSQTSGEGMPARWNSLSSFAAVDQPRPVSVDELIDTRCSFRFGVEMAVSSSSPASSDVVADDPLMPLSQLEAGSSLSTVDEISDCGSSPSRGAVVASTQPASTVKELSVPVSQLKTSPVLSGAREMSVSAASLSDVRVAVESTMPQDVVCVAAGDQTRNRKTAMNVHNGTSLAQNPVGAENNLHGVIYPHPAGVVCMDHQMCGLLADFVAHL